MLQSTEIKEKYSAIKELSLKRRNDRLAGYHNISDFHEGKYDSYDFVSPFTKSAANYNADIMLIAQDWSSAEKLSQKYNPEISQLGYAPALPTNRNLHQLLKNHLDTEFCKTYATNLFVFIKPGGISAPIGTADLVYSARTYTLPEISIIKPRFVVCLGARVLSVISKIIIGKSIGVNESLINPIRYSDSLIIGAFHPGGLGTAGAGGMKNIRSHWDKIGLMIKG
jgi:restriction system protein